MLQNNKDQIVCYHEHDSLLDHKEEEALSEEDRKAAWAEYEAEKKVDKEDFSWLKIKQRWYHSIMCTHMLMYHAFNWLQRTLFL